MAAVFDLHPGSGDQNPRDQIDQVTDLVIEQVRALDPHQQLERARRYKATWSAIETEALAIMTRNADGDERVAKRAFDNGKASKTAINKAAKRAAAAAKNQDLIDKAAAGDLSEEQMDLIGDTAAKTNGAAATDTAFIDDIAAANADQGKDIAARFVNDHTNNDRQSEHDRQRSQRRGFRYYSKKNGLDAITITGDSVAVANMWDRITAHSNNIYQRDGGSELANLKHPRTRDQRIFDAAHELICDITTNPDGTTTPTPHTGSKRPAAPQIVITLTADKYLGLDPQAAAEQIGLGLIADSVLADYLHHGNIIAMLYDHSGEPLWLHRMKRHASTAQRTALIARDKGCVLCRAPHQHCQAHHLMPWNAPGQGETNLDQLALLCGPCHRQLHNNNHTLYRTPNRRWKTRPATPHETPPKRTNHPQRE